MFTIGDNLIVGTKDEERTTASGLVLSVRDGDLASGVVEVVGPGKYFMEGNLVKGFVTVGCKVWFRKSSAVLFEDSPGNRRYVVSESVLLAYEPPK